MTDNLEFRWADPDDLAAIEVFLSQTFGPDSVQAFSGRCRWLYFENPLGLHVTLCLDSGVIVGFCGHLPQSVRVGSRDIRAGFGIDFMVAPALRRRGIGKRFLKMRLERFPLGLSFGQSDDMGALYRNLGAVDLGPMSLGIFRKRPSFGSNPKRVARNLAAWATGRSGLRITDGITVRPGNISDLDHPDPAWFAWRYGSGSPYDDCFGLALANNASSPGLAVCRSAADHDLVLEIQGPSEMRPDFLAALARNGEKVETRILFTGEALGEDCRKAGFLIRPHGARLIGMTGDRELKRSLDAGRIDLTSGAADGDLLRHPPSMA